MKQTTMLILAGAALVIFLLFHKKKAPLSKTDPTFTGGGAGKAPPLAFPKDNGDILGYVKVGEGLLRSVLDIFSDKDSYVAPVGTTGTIPTAPTSQKVLESGFDFGPYGDLFKEVENVV